MLGDGSSSSGNGGSSNSSRQAGASLNRPQQPASRQRFEGRKSNRAAAHGRPGRSQHASTAGSVQSMLKDAKKRGQGSGSRSSRKVTARISCSANPLSVSGSYLGRVRGGAMHHELAQRRPQHRGLTATRHNRRRPSPASLENVHLPPLAICLSCCLAVQRSAPPLQGAACRAGIWRRRDRTAAAEQRR